MLHFFSHGLVLYCDGTHNFHIKETGDNVGPLKIACNSKENQKEEKNRENSKHMENTVYQLPQCAICMLYCHDCPCDMFTILSVFSILLFNFRFSLLLHAILSGPVYMLSPVLGCHHSIGPVRVKKK